MKHAVLGAFTALITISSHAQIVHHDIIPDSTVSTWGDYTIVPSTNPSDDVIIWLHPVPEVVVQTHGNCNILFDAAGNFPLKLEAGDMISATGNWQPGNYNALNSMGTGNWQTNAADKYLAFRFKTGATWYYAWLKMSVAASATSFIVKEWAYNAQGQPIAAGQSHAAGIAGASGNHAVAMDMAGNQLRFTHLEAGMTYHTAVTDINGRVVQTAMLTGPSALIDLHQPAGIYIIRLQSASGSYCFRVTLP